MMKIKKNDTVEIIAGKDRGQRGKVLEVSAKTERVIVEGLNKVTKHIKPTQGQPKGRRVEKEASIHISNVMVVEKETDQKTRVGMKILNDGQKVRISKKTGKEL